jgi:hypothetical protein
VKSNFNGAPTHANAVRYTACSGAEVFAAGSLQFSWGLDAFRDPWYVSADVPASSVLEQGMSRALADLTVSHVPSSGPPDICVPAPAFTDPAPWAAVGQALTIRSTSTDPYGEIAGESWRLTGDGGSEVATGPSVSRTFHRPGTAHVALRVTDSSGAAATVIRTVRICACPAPPQSGGWPAGTEIGGRCSLEAFGSLRRIGGHYWFVPAAGVRRFSVTTERLASAPGVIGFTHPSRRTADKPIRLPAAAPRTAVRVDIATRIAGRVLRELFLIPARLRSPSSPPPRSLTAVTCDGTAAQVLTPTFGGPGSLPLRVAVTGTGRLTVRVSGPRGRAIVRHITVTGGRSVVMVWPSSDLPGGIYTVRVAPRRSWLPQPFTLAAVRVVPDRRPGRGFSPR